MAVTIADSVERLQGLQRDLNSLSEVTLPNIDRLWSELETRVDEFRELLDEKPKNDQSRRALSSDKVTLDDQEYTVSETFRQHAIQIADSLNVDEIEAAKILVTAEGQAQSVDRTPLATAIILYHQRRQFLLECLRLSLEKAYNEDAELSEDIITAFRRLATLVVQRKPQNTTSDTTYWRKCLLAMTTVETSLQHLAERIQSMVMTGQTQSSEFAEIMSFQTSSMMRQHECLGAITYWLTKGNQSNPSDLRALLDKVRKVDRYDSILVHHIPSLFAMLSIFASSEGNCSRQEAQILHQTITSAKEHDAWSLRPFQAAAVGVWLADYSGRFAEEQSQSSNSDSHDRVGMFSVALRDGAFQFMLAVGQDVREKDWYDPARQGLVYYLLQDTPALQSETFSVDESLQSVIMERLQNFADSYITYMPDSLRRLKSEEDDQRRQLHSSVQLRAQDHDLHFNRFLVIVSLAFSCCPIASEAFWDDPDGNLHGFLQWASQRQSTPRVAAFCEMLCSLSSGEVCANAAHKFLLDDTGSRSRKNSPLSWSHIFRELEFYCNSMKKSPGPVGGLASGRNNYPEQNLEHESPMMLESYLRLVTHLAKESPEARSWLLTRTTFNLIDHLLVLCASGFESRLRACAFAALSGLLTSKDMNTHNALWHAMDAWIYGQSQTTGSIQTRAPHARSPEEYEKTIFMQLTTRFEEPNAFVSLLNSLFGPVGGTSHFGNSLPFPEDLGTRYRMVGVDSYVDFVMDLTFARKSLELQDHVQLRIMRWNCLTFVQTCLSSFNEDLLILASGSKIVIDNAIETSSLAIYARIHPFARTMEWMFNDGVIDALFASAIQDMPDISAAKEGSSLILGVIQSIEAIDLVLSLQRTYFDVVRPIVKTQSNVRRATVANSALASYEDAITNHLNLIPTLGLYAGSGHDKLAITSLKLIQRLSRSPKLASPLLGDRHRRFEKSRLIAAMEKDSENYTISQWLAGIMAFDGREIESGPDCPGLVIKANVLQFVATSIAAVVDRPSVGHLLMGFACSSHAIYLNENSPIATSASLFHSILAFVIAAPDGQSDTLLSWLQKVKKDALAILRLLWRSPMSSGLVLAELRSQDFLCSLSLQQSIVQPDSLVDFKSFEDPDFLLSDAATGYAAFLQARSVFLEYAATELHAAHQADLATLKARIQSSLLGTTALLDGQQYSNPSILDYLDVVDIDLGSHLPPVESRFLDLSIFDCCKSALDETVPVKYDMRKVEQLLQLRQDELRKGGHVSEASDQQQLEADAQNFLQCFTANDRRLGIITARAQVLSSWVNLATVLVKCGTWSPPQYSAFVLQLLQRVLPQLERSYADDQDTALVLARFCQFLVRCIDQSSVGSQANDAASNIDDRLFDAFKTGLIGVQVPEAMSALRATCAQLCQGYLQNELRSNRGISSRAMQCVKSIGDQLMETLCEDAYAGEGDCRVAAMSLLDALVSLANEQQSTYVLESLNRFSFIQVLTSALKTLPFELRAATSESASLVLSFYDASLALLLRISQTRAGAASVFNGGFFAAVRDSGIFTADPDIGLDAENPDALTKYYDLMLAVVRVINAIILSRGTQNDQTISQARQFLHEYRPAIVQVYKRNARIGSADEVNEAVLSALVDNFTVLIGASEFLESEGEQIIAAEAPRMFT